MNWKLWVLVVISLVFTYACEAPNDNSYSDPDKGPLLFASNYFPDNPGLGIKYKIEDPTGTLDCEAWAVNQTVPDSPLIVANNYTRIMTITQIGTANSTFRNSTLAGGLYDYYGDG